MTNIEAVLQDTDQQLHIRTFSSEQHIICSGKPKATEQFCQKAKNKVVTGDKYFSSHAMEK